MTTKDLLVTKKDDIATLDYPEWGLETEALPGTWKNVNLQTGQISRIEMTFSGDKLMINCFGKLENGEMDWGLAETTVFSSKVTSKVVESFWANYDFGFMETKIAGNIKYGVMVIQAYSTFKDGSDRNNYFSREFFVFNR